MIILSQEFTYTDAPTFQAQVQAWLDQVRHDTKGTQQEFKPHNLKQSFIATNRVLVTLIADN